MPKTPMSPEEVEYFRGRILETALDIVVEQGYENLSIRKISSRLGVAATTIYNYYKNKEELNLMIRIRGFSRLYDRVRAQAERFDSPEDKIRAMVCAYVDFGIEHRNYYEVMFGLNTPKYMDYLGTPLEKAAYTKKALGLSCVGLFTEVFKDLISLEWPGRDMFILDRAVMFWSDLHGLIMMKHARLLDEIINDVDAFIVRKRDELIQRIFDVETELAGSVELSQ